MSLARRLTIREGRAYLKAAPAACNACCRHETTYGEEEVPMLRLFLALLISFAFLCTTGCETFRGFGRDVQTGGEKIEDAASK